MFPRSVVYGTLVVLLLGMVLALAGCGPDTDLPAGVASEDVNLSAKDRGGQVEVDVGQVLVLTLESNPTTGYSWQVVEAGDSVLRQTGEPEFKAASELDPPLLGAGGVEVFRFEAVGAGETRLELVYQRPWEEGVEPLETFSVQVVVR
jgi:inhibitor of cysteine peptidase